MGNDGRDYEQFVKNIQQAVLNSEALINQKNIKIESNKKLIDNYGIEREFDLYWEYELGGITYKTVIECKDYQRRVSIDKIDALTGKTKDLPGLTLVFATKTGYQSGAKAKAEASEVDLLIVREPSDDDWQDKDGNPLLRETEINVEVISAARTIKFSPEFDNDWAKKNINLDLNKPVNLNVRNDLITIEDKDKDKKYTLLELEERLGSAHGKESGEFTKKKSFDNAYIYFDSLKLKLRSYTIRYLVSPPRNILITFDGYKALVGVIEYLRKGTKTAIFTDKIIKNWH